MADASKQTSPTMSASSSSRQAIFAAKKALRRSMKRKLDALSPQQVAAESQAVLDHVTRLRLLDEVASPSAESGVSCYLSMQSGELNTDGLLRMILNRGQPLYVPVIPPPSSSSDMQFNRLYSLKDLEECCNNRDKWGIPDAGFYRRDVDGETQTERENAISDSAAPLRIIFTPGMAFDSACRRLGHGKGYYDRYFERYRAFAKQRGETRPLVAALALSEQILAPDEEIPVTEDDEFVDMVIHPGGVLYRDGVSKP